MSFYTFFADVINLKQASVYLNMSLCPESSDNSGISVLKAIIKLLSYPFSCCPIAVLGTNTDVDLSSTS